MLRTLMGLTVGFLCGCAITMGFVAPEIMLGSIVFSFISILLLFIKCCRKTPSFSYGDIRQP